MTIEDVTKMWSRGGGEDSTDDGITYKATFEEVYQVTHSADATDLEILAACPALMSSHPDLPSALVRKRGKIQRGLIFSYVPVTYSGGFSSGAAHPALQEPEWEWSDSNSNEGIDTDGNGLPFTNVNGEVLTGFTDDVADWVLSIKRNFFSINTYALRQYKRAVNSDWYGTPGNLWPPGTGWLQQFRARRMEPNSVNEYIEVTARILFREPYLTTPARAWWARYRNEGFYVRDGVKVTFTGGGGTGAAAYAVVSSGVITGIVVTNAGKGYTAAPTVVITASAGSGASATASISGDGVSGVSVGAGGTGYSSTLVRAALGGQPVNRPVLLKADGTYEPDASAAVWLERPKKPFRLPFSALGLL